MPLDVYSVDADTTLNGEHVRPAGGLFHTATRPHPPVPETYSYFWASEPATVTGSCDYGQVDLTLKRGWNDVRGVPGAISTATPPADLPWYFWNVLTDKVP